MSDIVISGLLQPSPHGLGGQCLTAAFDPQGGATSASLSDASGKLQTVKTSLSVWVPIGSRAGIMIAP